MEEHIEVLQEDLDTVKDSVMTSIDGIFVEMSERIKVY